MIFDVNQYIRYKELIIDLYKREGLNRAVEFASSSSIPLIITYTFLNDEFGIFDEEIKNINQFYNYGE